MSLEQEIRFKEQELARLRDRTSSPESEELKRLWAEARWVFEEGPMIPYDRVFNLLFRIVLYQSRVGNVWDEDEWWEMVDFLEKWERSHQEKRDVWGPEYKSEG